MEFLELSETQLRHQINSESLFTAVSQAKKEVAQVSGSMLWRLINGGEYLIRKSTLGKQTSIGPRTPETEAIYQKFVTRKSAAQSRYKQLSDELFQQQRINKATRTGRVPSIVVTVLNEIAKAGLEDHFTVVGTNALFAYETRCGVRIGIDAMVTEDVDLFFNANKHIKFLSHLSRANETLLDILRKADKSFQIREDQLYTAMNSQGYQVDFIRRPTKTGDAHPMKMGTGSEDDEAIWAVQVPGGELLESAPRFEQIVASTTGVLARMRTISPEAFVRIKRDSANDPRRDQRKAIKDSLQADLVENLMEHYHLVESPAEDRKRREVP
jgi:hypothetical protein